MTEAAPLIDLLQRQADLDDTATKQATSGPVPSPKPGWFSFLQKYTGKGRPTAPPSPTTTQYIIGDIHGRADLLENLLTQIAEDLTAHPTPAPHLVFVGDYVDRGEDSAAALTRLRSLEETGKGQVICLMGNHEKMLLDFLDHPETRGARWLKNGGLQTLASFGLGGGLSLTPTGLELLDLRAAFAEALPAGMEVWLRARPLIWSSGNLTVVHAAVDPARPVDQQSEKALLWGHKDFLKRPHQGGGWIAHGHIIVDQARAVEARISVDTGAYATHILTAARVTPDGGVQFLSTP